MIYGDITGEIEIFNNQSIIKTSQYFSLDRNAISFLKNGTYTWPEFKKISLYLKFYNIILKEIYMCVYSRSTIAGREDYTKAKLNHLSNDTCHESGIVDFGKPAIADLELSLKIFRS